jgi:O-antigen/teichoic acid export membrane protein
MKKRWLKKGFWAGMDQGLFAASNFAVNVLLARWLTPYEYGAFGLAFAIFLLVGRLHQAALLEPMLVFGPGRYKDRLSEYLGALVYGHFAFAALGSLALLAASLVFALWSSWALCSVMLALALTEPFILFLWFMRRACYARLEPRMSASGGAGYMVLMICGVYVIYWANWLSAASALGVMALSSLAVSLWLAVRLRVRLPPLRGSDLVRDTFSNHWSYGRWSMVNQGLGWVPMNIPYLILPVWGGLAAGASFRALMNLVRPVLQGTWALSNLLLPSLVRAREKGHDALGAKTRLALMFFTLGPGLYWLVVGLFHRPLVALLYGGQYTEDANLLWLLGLYPALTGVQLVLGYSVRALERPDLLLLTYALPAAAALIFGSGLIYLYGLTGGAVGILLSQMIANVMVVIFYRRLRRVSKASEERGDPLKPSLYEGR